MEHKDHNSSNEQNSDLNKIRKDLEPGRSDRNLFSEERHEAPIDKDRPMTANVGSDAADENYADEDMNDPDYFEKRAGDNVRK